MTEERIGLENESDLALLDGLARSVLAIEGDDPSDAVSSPARSRSSVVLPDPEGPSSARSSPGAISRSTWSRTSSAPNAFERPRMEMARGAPNVFGDDRSARGDARSARRAASRSMTAGRPTSLKNGLESERDQSEAGQERGEGESRCDAVLIVKNLHLKRDRVG